MAITSGWMAGYTYTGATCSNTQTYSGHFQLNITRNGVVVDETTFHAVRGAATVTFRVHAENDSIKPNALLVLRALVRVETPNGQLLGGTEGIKLVYFVIPPYIENPK